MGWRLLGNRLVCSFGGAVVEPGSGWRVCFVESNPHAVVKNHIHVLIEGWLV